jgi:hypothetical protein
VGRVVKLRRMGALSSVLWVLCWAGPRPAAAHPEQSPTLVNRYLTVAPAGTRLGLHVELLFGTVPAAETRRAMDADHDGKISGPELAAVTRAWTERAAEIVQLAIDGRPTPVDLAARIDLDGDNTTSAKPLLIEYAGQLPLDPGEHRIDVNAGPDLPRMGETELVLDATNPWILRTTLDDHGRSRGPVKLINHPGPRALPGDGRGASFVIVSSGPASGDGDGVPILPIAMVIFSIGLGVVLVVLVRKMGRPGRQAAK